MKKWGRAQRDDSSRTPARAEAPFPGFWDGLFPQLSVCPPPFVPPSSSLHPLSLSPHLAPHPPGPPTWLLFLTAWQLQGCQTPHGEPQRRFDGPREKLLELLRVRPRAGPTSLSLDPIGQTSQANPDVGGDLEPTAPWGECWETSSCL